MRYLSLLFILSISLTLLAQQPNNTHKRDGATLEEVREGFFEWLEEKEKEEKPADHLENEYDGLRTKFERWYYLMQTRVDKDGYLPNPANAARAWKQYKIDHPDHAATRSASWEPVGDAMVPINGGGAGRLNKVVLHPDDPNIIFVGAAGGGVWKSPDAGETWIPLTDDFPVTSIADIAIDPSDPDIIYVATGDGYGYEATWQADNDFWGGVYSAGLMKSTDGGLTWETTGLSYEQDELQIIQRVLINPEETNILLAATRSGIYRSEDSGATWEEVLEDHCHDMDFNTGDANIVYAVGNRDVFISEDKGETWEILENNLGASGDRMSIETTQADPDLLYVLTGNWGTSFYKSTNGGLTWSSTSSPGTQTYFFGYYDNSFEVSHVDGGLIFGGGLEVVRSINGASSWQKKSNWDSPGTSGYVHADNHDFACHPTNEDIIYSANDGGLFRSEDKGNTWTDLSNGLRIAQVYRLGTSATNPDSVLSGWQDNGTNLWDGSQWEEKDISTWDGMEALIDYTNSDIMFLTHQYGALFRTTNAGASWSAMGASGGSWVTPYVMDPNDPEVLYYGGFGALYRTTNGGDSWVYKNAALGDYVFALAVAPSNSEVVYAASLTTIKRSDNMADSWTTITGDLPLSGIGINYIAVDNEDEDRLWVALSGYDDGEKVYMSEDGGDSWTNVSGTLPNVPVNTIVYQNDSEDRLYMGTDIGVFYKDNYLEDWVPYMEGLPNVMIHELEINYTSEKLVAATYGRGIWQSDLAADPSINTLVGSITYCNGEELSVDYASTIGFDVGNTMTAELSDASGDFTSATVIGSAFASDPSGSISCVIPIDQPLGTGYRIRVVSSSPAITGLDNAFDIVIGCEEPDNLEATVTGDAEVTLTWDEVYCAESYEIRYREVGASWIASTSDEPSTILDGLSDNTAYEWSVQAVCMTDPVSLTSGYSENASFTTIFSGILSFEEAGINLYPNPADDQVTIEWTPSASDEWLISITDIRGREVFSGSFPVSGGQAVISRNGMEAGVYTIMIKDGDRNFRSELIWR